MLKEIEEIEVIEEDTGIVATLEADIEIEEIEISIEEEMIVAEIDQKVASIAMKLVISPETVLNVIRILTLARQPR